MAPVVEAAKPVNSIDKQSFSGLGPGHSQVHTPSASSGPGDAQELGAEIAAKDLVLDITADKDRGTHRLPLQSSCPPSSVGGCNKA